MRKSPSSFHKDDLLGARSAGLVLACALERAAAQAASRPGSNCSASPQRVLRENTARSPRSTRTVDGDCPSSCEEAVQRTLLETVDHPRAPVTDVPPP